jgi:O-antigen/teichoic acid export membrane protein
MWQRLKEKVWMSCGKNQASTSVFNVNILRSERFRRLSKEGFWVILGQVMAVIGSMVGVRLLTGLLSPTAYGELALGMSVATLVNQVVLGPLGGSVARFYAPAVERGDLSGYLIAVRRLLLSATGVVALIILLTVTGLLLTGRTEWIAVITASLVFAIFSGFSSILSSIQNAARQRSIVALHQVMDAWARFLIAAGFIILLGASSIVTMAGYSMAVTLVFGSQYLFYRKTVLKNISLLDKESNWRQEMLAFSWPISIFGMFTGMQLASDRWALKLFSTTHDVGLYSVLFQLGYSPMSTASGMLMLFIIPVLYQRAGDASDSRRNDNVKNLSWRITGFALGITGVTFIGALLLHSRIFQILVAKEYWGVSHLLPWMIFAGGVFAAGQTMAFYLQSQMKMRVLMKAKIITALIGVLFNFVGAYLWSTTGIVIAWVVFSVLYFFWMAGLSKNPRAK